MINYKNKEGWLLYKKRSDKYAPEIRTTINKCKKENDRQAAIKQIMHRLDVEAFVIKYRTIKSTAKKLGKYKAREVKDLSTFMKKRSKKTKNCLKTLKEKQ